MATYLREGPRTWGGSIDADGHRTWTVGFVVESDDPGQDGPAVAVQTPGLPVEGSIWAFGNDIDVYAWNRSGPTNIQQITGGKEGEPARAWYITYTYSTRPPDGGGPGGGGGSGGKDDKGSRQKCANARIEDPLQEPPALSGSGIRWSEEKEFDRHGLPLRYTSFERVRGANAEFDAHRDQIVVEQNVLNLEYELIRSLMDRVNDAPLWGLPVRCWKLSDWSWQRKLYGLCSFYFTRRLVFESNAREVPTTSPLFTKHPFAVWREQGPDGRWWLSGWDRMVLDESSKMLHGHWVNIFNVTVGYQLDNIGGGAPDFTKPAHYITARDPSGMATRQTLSATIRGTPIVAADDANHLRFQVYEDGDFTQLNLPGS